MIDLYTWTTPNGRKVSIMLEETGLPYRVHPINLGQGDQLTDTFRAINPESAHSGDRRSRSRRRAADRVRVGRDPDLPGREDEDAFFPPRCARAAAPCSG